MQKIYILILCLVLAPMLYGEGFFSARSDHIPFAIVTEEQFQDLQTRQEDSIYYTNMNVYNAIGLTAGGTFQYAIRLTDVEMGPYIGTHVFVAMFWHSYDGSSPTGQWIIYDEGSATAPGAQITTEGYSGASSAGFYRCDLSSPVSITGDERWCSNQVTHNSGTYPASVDPGPHVPGKSQWIELGGAWHELTYYNPSWTWNWVMGAIVDLIGIEEVNPAEEAITFGFANIPNPTKGHTPITYTTTQSGKVSLKVYDGSGRLVKTLVDRPIEAGTHTVHWDSNVANGVYFFKLDAEGKSATHNLILIK